jgi:anthranilate synthase component 2
MHITLIDNYDSFTYNLVHYLEEFDVELSVMKNDAVDWRILDFTDAIVLSPGPGLPHESNDLLLVIKNYHLKKPILGVCLGMQALAVYFGESLENQHEVKHGVSEVINVLNPGVLFEGIERKTVVGLYHSWKIILRENSLFISTSTSENDVLMSFEHSSLPLFGVQFHPESIMTLHGKKIIQNFVLSIQ